ncbi:glutamate racemase [Breoghania corrubedonensis]|uniref:Glutamate racemase n=2 Tax=Breoghania corrubedonensis TaxID=665038 RepID=A0A2T5UYR9_9HYPH|nr:glutamate racemase [Breoghania corrubedonensis]
MCFMKPGFLRPKPDSNVKPHIDRKYSDTLKNKNNFRKDVSKDVSVTQTKLKTAKNQFNHFNSSKYPPVREFSALKGKLIPIEAATGSDDDIGLSKLDPSQAKLKLALVDSGMGGGMTAALLTGEVRQLGSYYCLPIGDKLGKTAAAYTAAMALWPLIAPLTNAQGEIDGHIAEHVIIACNSASVRKDDAIALMKEFCAAVAEGRCDIDLNDDLRRNVIDLHEKIGSQDGYLENRVHEIVSRTAEVGVENAVKLLERDSCAFIRVDSTNGTVKSGAYPDRIGDAIKAKFQVDDVSRQSLTQTVRQDGQDFKISHTVYTFQAGGEEKTVVVENRGNPAWVLDIEANRADTTGPELVRSSQAASARALEGALRHFGEQGIDLSQEVLGKLETNTPEISMLCCTHYPAMTEHLNSAYGEGVTFINQATVVEAMAEEIDPNATNPDRGPLNLALTIGSQNYGGTPGNLKPSVPDPDATAGTLRKVLDTTLKGARQAGDNRIRDIGAVKVFMQGDPGEPEDVNPKDISSLSAKGVRQQQFELIHEFIGLAMEKEILEEQGLVKMDDGTLRFVRDKEKPKLDKNPEAGKIYEKFPSQLSEKLDALGDLVIQGEARGMDTIGRFNDQGAQFRAAVSQIIAVRQNNANPENAIQRVGVLTGFTVVDNESGERIEGENDGPPGAAIIARTLLKQGLPVTMVTDRSNEAALVSALVGAGLATVTEASSGIPANLRTLDTLDIVPEFADGQLAFEVPDFNNRDIRPDDHGPRMREKGREAVRASVENLKGSNVQTMISIERPSPTEAGGNLVSMRGLSVEAFNLDMSLCLGDEESGFGPVSIAIGDGGNELGTGGVQPHVQNARGANLKPFVARGDYIGAKRSLATDVMILGGVSNNAGVALSMAIDAAMQDDPESWDADTWTADETTENRLHSTIAAYNNTISHMVGDVYHVEGEGGEIQERGMSVDGVNKENLNAVDGRRMGFFEESLRRWQQSNGNLPLGIGPDYTTEFRFAGSPRDTSHNDAFLHYVNVFAPVPVDDPLSPNRIIKAGSLFSSTKLD